MQLEGHPSCGCDDFRLSRRRFLRGLGAAGGAAVLTSLVGDTFTEIALGADTSTNVLVVISLRGGADGLSMVVPHGDPAYATARPTIGIPRDSLIAQDDLFGLHPAFAPLLPQWNAGSLAAVHAVGLPQPNRSHFAAMELIEDADPGSTERRGWINRLVGTMGSADPVEAVQLGSGNTATSMFGSEPYLALSDLLRLSIPSGGGVWEGPTRESLAATYRSVGGPLGAGARAALDVSARLADLAQPAPPANGAVYPAGGLASALAQAARVVRRQIGARVVAVDAGGWDMHTQMGMVGGGTMTSRVGELTQSLAAFWVDLGAHSEQVTVVTVSEFGRRVQQNADSGLDHGYGNCMLAMGAGVNGGRYYARWPGLGAPSRVEGDLAVTVDYRSVLSELLASRFPDVSIPSVFPGFTRESVGVA